MPLWQKGPAAGGEPDALQPAQREIETNGVLETAKELGVTIIAYTPLARGLLSGKYHKNPDCWQLKRMARSDDARTGAHPAAGRGDGRAGKQICRTIAQVALNWVINFNGRPW